MVTKANSLEDHEVVAYINGVLDEMPASLRKFINEESTFALHGRVVFTKMVIRLNDGDDAPARKNLFEMRKSIAEICQNKPIGGKWCEALSSRAQVSEIKASSRKWGRDPRSPRFL